MSFARHFASAAAAFGLAAAVLIPGAGLAQGALSPQDQIAVDAASSYLQGIDQVRGRFVQTDSRGQKTQGEFFLDRPGKARFEYDPPSGLLVVADGRNVSVSDPRLKTFDRYPLGSTPLSLFLTKDITFERGVDVTQVTVGAGGFVVTARDKNHPEQGQLDLTFSSGPTRLKAWRLTDRQGRTTEVQITQLQTVSGLDPSLFVLEDPRGH